MASHNRYSFEDDDEGPLRSSVPQPGLGMPQQQHPMMSRSPPQDDGPPPPPPPVHRVHPGMHPSSAFSQLQAKRQHDVLPPPAASYSGQHQQYARPSISRKPVSPPPMAGYSQPPAGSYGHGTTGRRSDLPAGHEDPDGRIWGREVGYDHNSPVSARRESFTTPGSDNLGERAAGGGIAGIALGVAANNERESGLQALQDINNWGRSEGGGLSGARLGPQERGLGSSLDVPAGYEQTSAAAAPYPIPSQDSFASTAPLATAAASPGAAALAGFSPERGMPLDHHGSPERFHRENQFYADSPYNQYSTSQNALGPDMAVFDPRDIEDDGDDGITQRGSQRRSVLSLGRKNHSRDGLAAGAGAAVVGAGAGAAGTAGAFSSFGNRDSSGQYSAVPGGSGSDGPTGEKSTWLAKQKRGNRKMTWIVGTIIVVIVVAAIVGGVIGGVLSSRDANGGSSSSSSESAEEDDGRGDLSVDSDEIQDLMNNDDLHRVFPGIDYTPLNAQYPDCINTKPSQNNVTRDVAVLSQLTKEIRLYGTDCNQTEMVLHAIDRLELTDVKVWLGVWLGPNDTTNDRQLHQMYSLLDDHGADPFAGVIIGNEVLFREDLTSTELAEVLADVKSNLTERDLDLPLATSDLGDNWTQQLASEVDIVMANIHPFFAGVTADEAAAWTWNFWTTKDVVLTEGTNKKNYISEVGWPSAGGKSCGSASSCTEGSVAGIDEMNTFMEHWVCQSLTNGTAYFWFEAFDEPWKIQFNEDGKEWEDKWGLMDVNRNLKDGVKIPDCDGRTA